MRHLLTAALAVVALTAAAAAQEIDLFVTDYMGKQEIGEESALGAQKTDTATLFASPGEYEPFSFALQPRDRLESVMVRGGALVGPAGDIPAANVRVDSVESYHGQRCLLMGLGQAWDMPAWSKELFWVTVKVPDAAAPGTYRGEITITSQDKPVAALQVNLEVLPIHLLDPPLAVGWHYSWPGSVEALRAQLQDMREHGMTNVGPLYNWHLPVYDDDTSQLGLFIREYRAAGYREPIMFAAPMNLTIGGLSGYGPLDSKRFQQKYIEVMRRLWAEVVRHGHPVIFSIGDEFTNKGLAGVEYARTLARLAYEELPEIPITSDMNGYAEVMAMAPYLHFATFNNGWDGADRHNRGRRLLNEKFIAELKRETGAIPYFVNAGKGRFPFGFFLWKMSKCGVRGKVEWYYCLGDNQSGSVVRTRGTEIQPTIDYERSREGLDDLRYVTTLEQLIADAAKSGKARAEASAAESYLQQIEASIISDWTAYSDGGMRWPVDGQAEVDPAKAAALGSLNSLRRGVADHILAIQAALDRSAP